jgi:hypothetical protein
MALARADIIFARCKRGEKTVLVGNKVEGIVMRNTKGEKVRGGGGWMFRILHHIDL